MNDIEHLRYPVGRMTRNSAPLDARTREEYIGIIEAMPGKVRGLVSGLSDAQLDAPYRPGGWTVRQVVHHVPDSHMNAYVRMKLAVTEDKPGVKTYDEARWAELVVATVTYRIDARVAKQLESANEVYAGVIQRARSYADKPFRVSVK